MNHKITDPNVIFVFGSNLAGRHGAGAAYHAICHFSAEYRRAVGPQGRSYAIPTKDQSVLETLPLEHIESYVKQFLEHARATPDKTFLVTAIGCGLAGLNPKDIAPMFKNAPENVFVSPRFIL